MGKTAFITGTTGQDGSYLSELLLDKGYQVHGLIRRASVDTTERIAHFQNHPHFELVEGDITDAACMHRLISGIQPDEVYNLAAMSHVGVSFDQPIATCHIDAMGPLNILEAIRQSSPQSKFYQASTSELFGDTIVSPQSETSVMTPNSPYAVAKLYAHQLVGLYRRAYNVFACAGILFNHESERRGEAFVTRKITKYVAMIQDWMDTHDGFPKKDIDVRPLALGNIEAKRDWSHAEDMVRGMWLMMQHPEPDDYVLGSGETHTVKEFLQLAFGSIGLDYNDYITIDPKFYRPVDVNLLHADPSKAQRILGWEPTICFGELVDRMVQSDHRERIECRA
ncbi:MAG: GDP-mannose 4,6-dehydratase [Chloroflexi bacterium]|nr:MAG: GDP-mannose 4,6-dehydratase [Chloroflexota bacterium]